MPAVGTTSVATLSPAQQQAAAEAEATTAVMGLLPAIAEACGAASVDQLVAAERAALLAMCCPAEVAAVWLEAGVLGQLMLTQHAPQAPLLLWQGYGPHMALAAAGSSAGASSSKSATASPGEQGEQSPLWSPASLAAALATLQSQLQLLAAHSQAGVCVLACLSSSIEPLSALGAGSWSAGAAASTSTSSSSEGSVTAGEALVQLLAQVAGSCPTGRTLTLALRCIQQAVSSGMASAAALTPHLTPLVQTLVGQGLAAPSVACRLQACATITAVVAALNAAEAVLDADTLKCLAAGLVSKMADPSAAVQEAACAALGSGVVVAAKACDVHSSTEGDAGSSSSVVAWIKSQLGEGCKAAGADCPRAFNALLYRL
uniref:Uncharacterized protein n=1 Tax=Chlamydomonas leiostraca TaxID=1034604 RepID=A0A7S0WP03_9CHLO|mmetsp:Transcript_21398/g.54505  ORF Transcript_21398/g.54505 Transcript_21398/m.54505 type:complete len:374 (+) Transcript_21398:117-1238(+)